MASEDYKMTLNTPAKNVGGDKYMYTSSDGLKTGFIYVPQQYSRVNKTAKQELSFCISINKSEKTNICFNSVKQGKSGDDRYTCEDAELWKGDIYVDHKFRNSNAKIFIGIVH